MSRKNAQSLIWHQQSEGQVAFAAVASNPRVLGRCNRYPDPDQDQFRSIERVHGSHAASKIC